MSKEILSNAQIIRIIEIIEGGLIPDAFTFQNVNFWPHIRISLIARLKKQHKETVKSSKLSLVSTQVIKTCKKIVQSFWYCNWLDRRSNLKKVQYTTMIVAPYVHRYGATKAGFLNQHADALRNSSADSDSIGLIEYSFNFKQKKKRASDSKLLYLMPDLLGLKYQILSVLGIHKKNCSSKWLAAVDHINCVFAKENIAIYLNPQNLLLEVRRIEELASVFKKELLKHDVKHLINIVYCNFIAISFILAARKLGIKTTEYQHGSQDETHPHYSRWTLINDKGYELLPENYWVWSKNTFGYMSEWVDKTSFHNVRLTGNFYISPYLSEVKKSHKKKVILLTLQEPSLFPNFMFEVIKQTSDEWEWWVREHPRFRMRASFWNKLVDLSNNHIVNVSDGHLYHLFPNVAVHMTGFSTCAFEAELFDVPTIFFDKHAEFGYQSLISKCKHLVYASNFEQVLASIDDILDIPITPSGFIEEAKHSVDYFLARLK
ncbi:hypothetical protein [Paraglaciecola sp.]|uniref:hypothetical protein n=1 Tax=Paraglaciecola sp. TaxID=1920173 RepID=UPI0032638413